MVTFPFGLWDEFLPTHHAPEDRTAPGKDTDNQLLAGAVSSAGGFRSCSLPPIRQRHDESVML